MVYRTDEKETIVTATEFKQNLGKHLECVSDELVITKNGKKIAKLTPYITDVEEKLIVQESVHDYQYGGKKVSYDEFITINDQTTLRMEYINGEIYLLASPNLWHQELLGRLYSEFKSFFIGKSCRVMMAPFDIRFYKPEIKDPDVIQPDLFVICDLKGNLNTKGHYMGTPTLAVEILSNSTRSKDMVDKLNTYMLSGVREYWIIDFKQQQVIVYYFVERAIDSLLMYKKGEKAVSLHFEGLDIEVNTLFEALPEADYMDVDGN